MQSAHLLAKSVRNLFAEIEALQHLVVLGEVMLLQVVEELATAACHREKSAARVKVLAVFAQVLG